MLRHISVIYPGDAQFSYTVNSDLPNANILEEVFHMWNYGSGMACQLFLDSRMRSLSVNDIVSINDVYYQCKSIGWEKISRETVEFIESRVTELVRNKKGPIRHDPWSALLEVMRDLTKTSFVI